MFGFVLSSCSDSSVMLLVSNTLHTGHIKVAACRELLAPVNEQIELFIVDGGFKSVYQMALLLVVIWEHTFAHT